MLAKIDRFIKEKNATMDLCSVAREEHTPSMMETIALAEKVLTLSSAIEEDISDIHKNTREKMAILCDSKEEHSKMAKEEHSKETMEEHRKIYEKSKGLLIDLVKAKVGTFLTRLGPCQDSDFAWFTIHCRKTECHRCIVACRRVYLFG